MKKANMSKSVASYHAILESRESGLTDKGKLRLIEKANEFGADIGELKFDYFGKTFLAISHCTCFSVANFVILRSTDFAPML